MSYVKKSFFPLYFIITVFLFFSPGYGQGSNDPGRTTILEQEIQKCLDMGDTYIALGNYKDAENEYKKALALDSDCIKAHEGYISSVSYQDKSLKKAFKYYQDKIETVKEQDASGWYFGLGLCYVKTNDNNMAKINWGKTLQITGYTKRYELQTGYLNYMKSCIPEIRLPIPGIYKTLSLGSIIIFALAFLVFRYIVKKKVIEQIIKLEGNFEVFNPRGFKVFILDCSDKKFFQKHGDRITVGSKKGCDICLKIKGEEKIYAILEAEKIEEQNRITINVAEEEEELYLEVPKSRYTPDETVKLPFKGSPLWDKDIINIKDYRIHYHNVKVGKRLWKDYPESAKGYIFADDKPAPVEVPDMEALALKAYEGNNIYQPYEELKKTVKIITSSTETITEFEEEIILYDILPMDEKYIEDLPPLPEKTEEGEILQYKIEENEEDYYKFEPLPDVQNKNDKSEGLLIYPVEEEGDYVYEDIVLSEVNKEKREDVLIYPAEEEEDYEYEVLAPETGKEKGAHILTYPAEEDDKEYKYEEIVSTGKEKSDNTLSYPSPTEDDNEILCYSIEEAGSLASQKEEKKDFLLYKTDKISSQSIIDNVEILNNNSSQKPVSDIKIEKSGKTVSLIIGDETEQELPSVEVYSGLQGLDFFEEKKPDLSGTSGFSLDFSFSAGEEGIQNRGVSLEFAEIEQEEEKKVSLFTYEDMDKEEDITNIKEEEIKKSNVSKVKKEISKEEKVKDKTVKKIVKVKKVVKPSLAEEKKKPSLAEEKKKPSLAEEKKKPPLAEEKKKPGDEEKKGEHSKVKKKIIGKKKGKKIRKERNKGKNKD